MFMTIDGNAIQSRKDFYDAVASMIELPEYFGNNLDALYDVLTEKDEEITVRITGIKNFAAALDEHYCQRLLSMLIEAKATLIIKE